MNSLSRYSRLLSNLLTYGPRLRPVRDWFVLLIIFFILLVASVLWNVVQFSRVVQGQQIGSQAVIVPASIKLDAVQALFIQRAQERGRYQNEYRFVDPSR